VLPVLSPSEAARYAKRLAIIVPYRDRTEHLAAFVRHVPMYFERDKLDRQITHAIHIVEQTGRAPFNRGKLLNCGYVLARDADYFCFHDVDYLPIWADYSWSPHPARLIWHGLRMQEDPENFFGAVTLFDKPVFERVNGFPNSYWGWGFEDTELRLRCMFGGIGFERRDGTYYPLPHDDPAFSPTNELTEPARKTFALYESRRPRMAALMREDGLTNLNFTRLDTRAHEAASTGNIFHHLVDIGGPE
jgi:hypothetical protein